MAFVVKHPLLGNLHGGPGFETKAMEHLGQYIPDHEKCKIMVYPSKGLIFLHIEDENGQILDGSPHAIVVPEKP